MNEFLKEFKDRGYFYQCTDEKALSKKLNEESIKGYIGFDCTAQSLHVGSLLQIMCLRLMQKHGHKPIVLLGGGTTRIGDPSGKDKTRKILEENEIEKNIKSIENILKKFLETKDEKVAPIFVNNYTWLKNLNYISFLRDIGKHFTINKMLSFDSVKLRLEREQSLSYMEFNYMILQAYDFLELNKKNNCVLQIGGSDQWGNIVNGVELIKRHSNKLAYGLTTRKYEVEEVNQYIGYLSDKFYLELSGGEQLLPEELRKYVGKFPTNDGKATAENYITNYLGKDSIQGYKNSGQFLQFAGMIRNGKGDVLKDDLQKVHDTLYPAFAGSQYSVWNPFFTNRASRIIYGTTGSQIVDLPVKDQIKVNQLINDSKGDYNKFDSLVRKAYQNSPGVKNDFLDDLSRAIPQSFSGVFR